VKSLIISSFLILFLIGCSASTGTRYDQKEEKKSGTETPKETKKEAEEDFDITPYKTDIDIETPTLSEDKLPPDVWYGYKDTSSVLERKIIGTTDGYRVQVLSTDDIEEANRVRAEIYEKTARK
jgi:hypothetical protein